MERPRVWVGRSLHCRCCLAAGPGRRWTRIRKGQWGRRRVNPEGLAEFLATGHGTQAHFLSALGHQVQGNVSFL